MSFRFYLCPVVVVETTYDKEVYPLAATLLSDGTNWLAIDGRSDARSLRGEMLVQVSNISDLDHAKLLADPRITYIPLEDSLGEPVEIAAKFDSVTTLNRDATRTRLRARHIPVSGLNMDRDTKQVPLRIVRRFLLRSLLGSLDFVEPLGSDYAGIAPERRAALEDRLLQLGYNLDDIQPSDTVETVIRKLLDQNNPWNRTHLD